jgi:hypothetical protein
VAKPGTWLSSKKNAAELEKQDQTRDESRDQSRRTGPVTKNGTSYEEGQDQSRREQGQSRNISAAHRPQRIIHSASFTAHLPQRIIIQQQHHPSLEVSGNINQKVTTGGESLEMGRI